MYVLCFSTINDNNDEALSSATEEAPAQIRVLFLWEAKSMEFWILLASRIILFVLFNDLFASREPKNLL